MSALYICLLYFNLHLPTREMQQNHKKQYLSWYVQHSERDKFTVWSSLTLISRGARRIGGVIWHDGAIIEVCFCTSIRWHIKNIFWIRYMLINGLKKTFLWSCFCSFVQVTMNSRFVTFSYVWMRWKEQPSSRIWFLSPCFYFCPSDP